MQTGRVWVSNHVCLSKNMWTVIPLRWYLVKAWTSLTTPFVLMSSLCFMNMLQWSKIDLILQLYFVQKVKTKLHNEDSPSSCQRSARSVWGCSFFSPFHFEKVNSLGMNVWMSSHTCSVWPKASTRSLSNRRSNSLLKDIHNQPLLVYSLFWNGSPSRIINHQGDMETQSFGQLMCLS